MLAVHPIAFLKKPSPRHVDVGSEYMIVFTCMGTALGIDVGPQALNLGLLDETSGAGTTCQVLDAGEQDPVDTRSNHRYVRLD
jgi:hypothetical protein